MRTIDRIVGTGELLNVGIELIGADEGGGLFGVNGVGLAAAGDFAFTADDGDHGGVAVFVDRRCDRCRDEGRRKARLGVSISKVSFCSRRLTRTRRVPSVIWIWATLSSRLRNEKPVVLPRRRLAEPMWSSARAPLSAQSLSPVVMGRLMTALTQSSVPAGLKETAPSVWLRRATRVGGSSALGAAEAVLILRKGAKRREECCGKKQGSEQQVGEPGREFTHAHCGFSPETVRDGVYGVTPRNSFGPRSIELPEAVIEEYHRARQADVSRSFRMSKQEMPESVRLR